MKKTFGNVSRTENSLLKWALAMSLGVVFVSSAALVIVLNFSDNSEASVGASPVTVERTAVVETVNVLVPLHPINGGVLLEPTMFKIEARSKVGLSDKYIRDFEELKGKYSKSLILDNQPLHSDYLTDVRPINAITASIPQGYRAVTIRVDERTSIEGFARAGAKVDVTWITNIRGKPAVNVIVENARVLSAARKVEADTTAGEPVPTELTLLVPVEDANKIHLASLSGTISLSLRGDRDAATGASGNTITTDDLIDSHSDDATPRIAESIVKIRDNNGNSEDFVLRQGRLVPLSEAKN